MQNYKKSEFDTETLKDLSDLIVNMNRYLLNQKDHIKKYNKLRKLHSEILDSMQNYIFSDKYDSKKYNDLICEELSKQDENFEIMLDYSNEDDITVYLELFVYKNHPAIPSVTEIYLENNKFKNAEKVKFLECMKNSYVGLFKVIDVDSKEGYVTYQDVFTKKKFKIIDIAASSTLVIDKKMDLYTYNRIITFDDISFATGIHCHFSSESKSLMNFIKNHKYTECSDFIRCLLLYDISKKDNKIISNYNHSYGYR